MGYIRLSDAAALLGVHPNTLVNWRNAGIGPPYHVYAGGQTIYKQDEVLAWQQAQRVTPAPVNGHQRRGVRDVEAAAYFERSMQPAVPMGRPPTPSQKEQEYLDAIRNGTVEYLLEEVLPDYKPPPIGDPPGEHDTDEEPTPTEDPAEEDSEEDATAVSSHAGDRGEHSAERAVSGSGEQAGRSVQASPRKRRR